MKNISATVLLLIISMSSFLIGCSDDDDDDDEYGNWVESSTFDGNSRGNAISFTIGDKGYIVGGYDGDDYLADLWEYSSEDNYWVRKADFPGIPRSGAIGFSINGKGYIGTGYDGNDRLNDFWEYNPETDQWTQKTDFAGTNRYGAIGFSLNGKGYIGTGYDGSEQKDFWMYDPTTDTWEQIVGFGGEKRQNGAVFIINDVAYIGSGIHNGSYETDFYAFDGSTWTRLNDLEDHNDDDEDIYMSSSVGFSLGNYGYLATGISGGGLSTICWQYNPTSDTWYEMPNFEGAARQDGNAFTFNNKAFVLMGRSSSYYFDDIWEFRPDQLENDDD